MSLASQGDRAAQLYELLRAAEGRAEALRAALGTIRSESTYRGPDRLRHIARVAMEADDFAAGRLSAGGEE